VADPASKDSPSEGPVNSPRAALYARLMEAQDRIAQALYETGVDDATVQTALDAADEKLTDDERREDLYLAALSHYVRALGGQLEVRAVFGDESIVVSGSS
jgi:hypothetical protein